MELSYTSRNGVFFPYISVMFEEVTFQVQKKLKNPPPKKHSYTPENGTFFLQKKHFQNLWSQKP